MIRYEKENDIIYAVGDGVRYIYCAEIILQIHFDDRVRIGDVLPMKIRYVSWEGKELLDENTPICIEVQTRGEIVKTAKLTPENGVAEFDFISQYSGSFYITAYADGINSQPDIAEVIVYE